MTLVYLYTPVDNSGYKNKKVMEDIMVTKKLLKEAEVREMLSISRGSIYNLREKGYLTPIYLGRACLYDIEDVMACIERLREASDGDDTK